MTRSRFSQTTNAANRKSSSTILILQLTSIGLAITLLAAVFVQNLQPAVQISFLGQKTIEIPLSVAMLVAFVGGGILAFVFNAIASWRQNLLIRRAVIASGSGKDPKEQVKAEKFQSKEEFEEEEEEYEDEEEYEEEDEEEYEDNDPDTVPYGNRSNMKSKDSRQVKRDRPPLDAKFIK
ncbi:lipopolysaccharide assembly protein LapA domain-containing protein [Pseudanabaena sp. BC1403]|uniref:lipopolysaccharide assembly protein LapA domain-containing protein n=1 Tax=Pseudanabaena sp. BC1403 TaxID=2043171 RepID=UPI000CD981E7|nr:LapA family protein [Pseudanabaena sp. BC1403]